MSKRDQMGGVESGIDMPQVLHRAYEEARAHQQKNAEPYLQ